MNKINNIDVSSIQKIEELSSKTIVIGLSGGVDSAVAAWLLKQLGAHVIGLFMKNWEDENQRCFSHQDWIDAVSAADLIGIDIEMINFTKEYKDHIFLKFLKEYSIGNTPNPDVFCNSLIKFNCFLKHAIQLGADFIATGHYAIIKNINEEMQLFQAFDNKKDQSYFLYRLNQNQLKKTIFPLGGIRKDQVRDIARSIGLSNANKKDSTGICFIGKRKFRDFLSYYLKKSPGPIRNDKEQIIGQHIGLPFYTIGQRRGIGIGGTMHGTGDPWFVAKKEVISNTLYVVQNRYHPWLSKKKLYADQVHWISNHPKSGEWIEAKIRYCQSSVPCKLLSSSEEKDKIQLNFKNAQWAITPGQSVVLYQNKQCLGGGVIGNL